jgi:integrase
VVKTARRFTQRQVMLATYRGPAPRRDIRYCDPTIPGLGLRLYPSGKKAFVLRYRSHGRERLMVLGRLGVLTLEQARKKARRERDRLETVDPLDERAKRRSGSTVREVLESYIERYGKVHRKTWGDDKSRFDRHVIPRLGARQAASIRRRDVEALHHRIGKQHGPYEANRTIETLRAAFYWGGVVDDEDKNPARFARKRESIGIRRFPEVKRERYVTREELPALAKAIDSEDDPYARAALWLYMLTGLRKRELLRIRRADIDWQRKEVRIGETKAGRPLYLPLSEPAIALLRELPELAENPYVFPGRRRGQHLVNVDKAWRRAREAADIKDVRLHDLRRTLGSWLAQAGNSLHLIGRVLNQTSPAATQIYARFSQDSVREAMERTASNMLAIAKQEKADVVAIKR